MKKRTTLLMTIGMLALATTTTFANDNIAFAKTTITYNKVNDNQIAKKLVITGNVAVTLVQDYEAKKLYTKDGIVRATVYEEDNVIYVKGKNNTTEPAKVTVYVANISRIDISGNATIDSKNNLNVKYLQILVKDKANAALNVTAKSLYTRLANEAALKLTGKSDSFAISTNDLSTLNTSNFKATNTDIEKRVPESFSKGS